MSVSTKSKEGILLATFHKKKLPCCGFNLEPLCHYFQPKTQIKKWLKVAQNWDQITLFFLKIFKRLGGESPPRPPPPPPPKNPPKPQASYATAFYKFVFFSFLAWTTRFIFADCHLPWARTLFTATCILASASRSGTWSTRMHTHTHTHTHTHPTHARACTNTRNHRVWYLP